jgi:ferredoxin
VLGVISVFFHRHVKVRHADRCRGCLLCVRACEHGAIQALRPQLRRHEATSDAGPVVDPSSSLDAETSVSTR